MCFVFVLLVDDGLCNILTIPTGHIAVHAVYTRTHLSSCAGAKRVLTSAELENCWSHCAVRSFGENATPRQQHWAVSVQKQPSNHSMMIGQ